MPASAGRVKMTGGFGLAKFIRGAECCVRRCHQDFAGRKIYSAFIAGGELSSLPIGDGQGPVRSFIFSRLRKIGVSQRRTIIRRLIFFRQPSTGLSPRYWVVSKSVLQRYGSTHPSQRDAVYRTVTESIIPNSARRDTFTPVEFCAKSDFYWIFRPS